MKNKAKGKTIKRAKQRERAVERKRLEALGLPIPEHLRLEPKLVQKANAEASKTVKLNKVKTVTWKDLTLFAAGEAGMGYIQHTGEERLKRAAWKVSHAI